MKTNLQLFGGRGGGSGLGSGGGAGGGYLSFTDQPAPIRQAISQLQVMRATHPRGISASTRKGIGSGLDNATNDGDVLAIKGRENSVYYTKVGKNKWSFGSGEEGTPHDSGYILENLIIMGGEIVYKKKR